MTFHFHRGTRTLNSRDSKDTVMAATGTIERPLVTSGVLEEREYQIELARRAGETDSLVCLPTGLGKTTVSLLVTARRLHEHGGTALMLAPTKPLVTQHAEFYREALAVPDEEIVVFTGEVRPDDRAALWEDARVVLATPQVVENDLLGGRISLSSVTHCTFDESSVSVVVLSSFVAGLCLDHRPFRFDAEVLSEGIKGEDPALLVDHGLQILPFDRLAEILVEREFEHVETGIDSRHHNYATVILPIVEFGEHFVAGHIGHMPVEQHDIDL